MKRVYLVLYSPFWNGMIAPECIEKAFASKHMAEEYIHDQCIKCGCDRSSYEIYSINVENSSRYEQSL